MRLLVLGGTHHVGRAVVEEALARGDRVTTVTRGLSGPPATGADPIYVDRRDAAALETALGTQEWDAVLDTWSSAPQVVHTSAGLLSARVGHYGYVSSRSVYRWPIPPALDESAPVVDGNPADTDDSDYAAAKRGSELAAMQAFGGTVLLARAGLVLGPYEIVGRLPWWLGRLSRGGRVLAPGPADRKLQYIDARDLAIWMLDAAVRGVGGAFNAVSRPGHTTMGGLLDACVDVAGPDAELVWTSPEVIEAAGISGWTDLPIWVPPTGELAGLHDGDVSAAYAEGLYCRPVEQTVADTWAWLQREGFPTVPAPRAASGLDPDIEKHVLDAARA